MDRACSRDEHADVVYGSSIDLVVHSYLNLLWDKLRAGSPGAPGAGFFGAPEGGSPGAPDPAESDPGARAYQPDQYDQCR